MTRNYPQARDRANNDCVSPCMIFDFHLAPHVLCAGANGPGDVVENPLSESEQTTAHHKMGSATEFSSTVRKCWNHSAPTRRRFPLKNFSKERGDHDADLWQCKWKRAARRFF